MSAKPEVPDEIKKELEQGAFRAAFKALDGLDLYDGDVTHKMIVNSLVKAIAAADAFEEQARARLNDQYEWLFLDTSQTVTAAYAAWLLGLDLADIDGWSCRSLIGYRLTSFVVFTRLIHALSNARDFVNEGDDDGVWINNAPELAKTFPHAFPPDEENP